MALDFEGGGLFGKRRSTQQFDLEKEDIKYVHHDFSGGGEETVYTVTTGKTYWITDMMLINDDGVNPSQTYTIKLDDGVFIVENVLSHKTTQFSFDIPIPLTSGKTIKVTGGISTVFFAVVGFEK